MYGGTPGGQEKGKVMNGPAYSISAYVRGLLFDLLLITAVILFSLGYLQLTGCATTSEKQGTEKVAKPESMEERWGVEIIWVRQTAAGYMLDFRYRVLDAEKAAPLFKRKTKPYLIHQASGAKFVVPNPPKTGPLRTSDKPKEGITYWMFFGNPGRYIKPGDQVTVVIGDFKAKNLVVQ